LFPKLRLCVPERDPSEDEVLKKIAALKARRRASLQSVIDFYFDPNVPLRLIDPGKKDSND
jgi:hypothetical protein